MKKIIFLIVTSLTAVLWLNSITAQSFQDFLIDWSRYTLPYNQQPIELEDLEEGASLSVNPDEPMLVEQGSEEYVWVKIAAYTGSSLDSPLTQPERNMFYDANKLQHLDIIKPETINKLTKMHQLFVSNNDFKNISAVNKSLDILSREETDMFLGESDFSIKSIVDSFKCIINSDRYFFAIVNFVDERIFLKSIGVCQKLYIDFWLDQSVNQLVVFLLNISGKSRQEAQEIIEQI